VRQMLVKSYLDEGRLTNMYRVMSFFPTFYEIFHISMNSIIKASIGPLHRTWRIYLGIMVRNVLAVEAFITLFINVTCIYSLFRRPVPSSNANISSLL
jgi:hypothetical protein